MKTRLITTLTSALLALGSFGACAQNLTNGLIAFYTFEGNANDISGNGNHTTPAGNYQFITKGLSGGAFRAIGDNAQYYAGGGHVLLPTFGDANLNAGFTFSFWVRDEIKGPAPAADVETYVSFGNQTANQKTLAISLHHQDVIWGMNNYATDTHIDFRMPVDLPAYTSSGWKHLSLSYAPGRFACFFNGQKLYETNTTIDVFPVAQAALNRHWWDGGTSSSARMSCTYDNVRIYNRALSDEEVRQLYVLEKNPLPYLTIGVKTLRLTLYLEVSKTYQLQSSTDNQTWSNYGSPFVAVVSPVAQDVEVTETARFFRVKEVVSP